MSASTRRESRRPRTTLELAAVAVTLLIAGAGIQPGHVRSAPPDQAVADMPAILALQPTDGEAAVDPADASEQRPGSPASEDLPWQVLGNSWFLQATLLAAVLVAYLVAVESTLRLQKKPLRIIIQPRPDEHRNGTMRLVYFSFAISAIFFLNGQHYVGGGFLVFAAAYLLWRSRDLRRARRNGPTTN